VNKALTSIATGLIVSVGGWFVTDYVTLRSTLAAQQAQIEAIKADNGRLWQYGAWMHDKINDGRKIDGAPLLGPPAFK